MKKLLLNILILGLVISVTVGVTRAYLFDTETSTGNTFSAGSLDLNIDGGNTNVVKFTVTDMKPDDQIIGTYTLNNVGTVDGYLDMEDISVANQEHDCLDPETEAGDSTCGDPGDGEGELQDLVNMKLLLDRNCDSAVDGGDTVFYDGVTGSVAGNYELDEPLNASDSTCVTAIFDWTPSADDNLAQVDDMTLNMTFELAQTTGQ